MKVHITPDGPKPCEARSEANCKYSSNDKHYDSMAEAQVAYEKKMEEKHGIPKYKEEYAPKILDPSILVNKKGYILRKVDNSDD